MQKKIVCFGIVFFAILQMGYSQAYVISGIEKTDKEGMQYEIVGKVADSYWIYKKNDDISTIAIYNEKMKLVKQNDLTFLPSSIQSIEWINKGDKVFVFYQFQKNTTVYAAVARLDANGALMNQPEIIDTTQNIHPGSKNKIFNVLNSDDKKQIVIFSINTTNHAAIKVKTISFDANFDQTNEATISINAINKKSHLTDFALDNQGNLFCLRNITQENNSPAVSLIYMASNGKEVLETPIVNNQLILDDIRLKIDNANNRVLLNSFYAVTRKGNVDGLFMYIFDIQHKSIVLSTANRFTDATRALVSKKRKLQAAFDNYYIDEIATLSNGNYVLMTEAAETYANRLAFSRWDYFWGGPFYNPYVFHYWNRPFGFYPWGRFGSSWGWSNPSVTYTAKQIALLSFDIKGNLQWVKTIDKSQSDMNVDQFIGYGSFENADGSLSIVYYNKENRQRQFVIHNLTTNGQLNKEEMISLQEKGFDWILRGLKQVGEKACIIPYQYNNKIGFAKIQLK